MQPACSGPDVRISSRAIEFPDRKEAFMPGAIPDETATVSIAITPVGLNHLV